LPAQTSLETASSRSLALRSVANWPTGQHSVVGNDPAWHQRSGSASLRRPFGTSETKGLTCDGVTDDYPTIQARLNAGGTVRLPARICAIGKTLVVTKSNTFIVGAGGSFQGGGSFKPASSLKWEGAPGGTILQFGSGRAYISGGGMTGVALISNQGLAGSGLNVVDVEDATFAGITGDSFTEAVMAFDGSRRNVVQNYSFSSESPCNSGAGIVLNNSQHDVFDDSYIVVCNGTGIELLTTLEETINDTHEQAPGSGLGVLFGCGSHHDVMNWLSPLFSSPAARNSVRVYGAQECGTASGSKYSSIDLYDVNDNSSVPPVVAPGTDFTCTTDGGTPCVTVTPVPNGVATLSIRYKRVTCNGIDDYAPIQSKLARGGTTILAGDTCAISQTLKITRDNTFLEGAQKTTLKWIGPANGTVLLIGGTGNETQGGGVSDLDFDSSGGSASIGLDLEGVEGATFTNISANAFNDAAIALGQMQSGLNTMNNLFTNYVLRNTDNTGAGVLIDTSCGIFKSEPRENACWTRRNLSYYNQFVNGVITVSSGVGIDTLASDGNLFQGVRIIEDAPVRGAWQGVGVFFGCDSVSNHVQGLSFSANGQIASPSWNIVALGSYPARTTTKNLLDVCKYDAGSRAPYTTTSFSDSVQQYAEDGTVAAAPLSGTVNGGNVICVNGKCTNYGKGDKFWCTTVSNQSCGFQSATDPRARRLFNQRLKKVEALQLHYGAFAARLPHG
jgi:hypothetical protein